MRLATVLEYAALLFILLAVGALLFGQALGQPVLLGYVETGSMAPTLDPGDGFVAVPSVITGPAEPGDVVVFNAEELHGGGLVTHRVVGETEAGYITQGDANPFPDQQSVEPPVTEDQIVAHAFEINGEVVVIENLGTYIGTVQGFLTGVVGTVAGVLSLGALIEGAGPAQSLIWIGVGLIVVTVVSDALTGDRSGRSRSRRRSNYVGTAMFLLVLSLVVLAPATASMVIPSGTTSFDIVSSQSPSEDPLVIGVGGSSTVEYRVINNGYVPMMTVVESNHPDIEIDRSDVIVPPKSEQTFELTIRAPESTGAYSRSVDDWRYLPVLPRSIILSLHAVHPYLAIAAIDLLLLLGAVAAGLIAVGVGPIRLRSTSRQITLLQRLKRRFF